MSPKDELLSPRSPLIRKIPASDETRFGKAKEYVYETRCAKCGGELRERSAWEVVRWSADKTREVKLVCEGCAKKAIRYYEEKLK